MTAPSMETNKPDPNAFANETLKRFALLTEKFGAVPDQDFVIKLPVAPNDTQAVLLVDQIHPDFSLNVKVTQRPCAVIVTLLNKADHRQIPLALRSPLLSDGELITACPQVDMVIDQLLGHFQDRLHAMKSSTDWTHLSNLFPTADL